jgi:hypothetical protein
LLFFMYKLYLQGFENLAGNENRYAKTGATRGL